MLGEMCLAAASVGQRCPRHVRVIHGGVLIRVHSEIRAHMPATGRHRYANVLLVGQDR